MIMLGTFINSLTIIVCAVIGLLLSKGLKENYKEILLQAVPLAVIFIGMSGTLKGLMSEDAEPLLFIISLVIGGLAGEIIGIEASLERLGEGLQKKFGNGEGTFAKGFVSATLIFCVGSMAILGSLDSGLRGNHETLFAKSILDGVLTVILTSSLGIGVAFSALSVLIYQGSITLMSGFIAPYMTADMLREISIVGGVLIFSLGMSMLDIVKIKTGNLLPAILVPVIYYLFRDHAMVFFLR